MPKRGVKIHAKLSVVPLGMEIMVYIVSKERHDLLRKRVGICIASKDVNSNKFTTGIGQ